MLKKIVTIFTVFLVISSFSLNVDAQELIFGDYTYKIVNGNVCITRYTGNDVNVVLPTTIDGKLVTSILPYAFEESDSINSIVIPKSMTNIDDMSMGYYRDIDDENSYFILSDLKIYCFKDSAAEKYAKTNNFDYEIISYEKPKDVTGFKVSSVTDKSVKLSWNKVVDADGYIVYQKKNGKWTRIVKTKTPVSDYTVSKLAYGNNYSFAVKAYRTVALKEITSNKYPTVTTTTKMPTVTNFAVSAVSDSAVKLTWKNVTGSDGYILYRYDVQNKKWVRIVKTTSPITTYTIKKLKTDSSYKFAIKSYKTINGKEISSVSYPSLTAKTNKAKTKITVKNGITYVDGVLVVNKTYSIPSTYNPGELTAETKNAFIEMKKSALKSNITLTITSGFRSYSYQDYLYKSYVSRDGKTAADRYSARAGHSEHQTGLAIDVNNASGWFNDSKEAAWLEKHCWKYGFILRYPKGKENKTGYQYESWHIRYVGKDLAKKITESGLCFEEYFGITSQYK